MDPQSLCWTHKKPFLETSKVSVLCRKRQRQKPQRERVQPPSPLWDKPATLPAGYPGPPLRARKQLEDNCL